MTGKHTPDYVSKCCWGFYRSFGNSDSSDRGILEIRVTGSANKGGRLWLIMS